MGYGAKVDKQACASSGRCCEAAPEAFFTDPDSLAEFRSGAAVSKDRMLAIARACPALAIRVFDEQGREIDFDA